MRLLQGASEDWEVILEPIGKWCNIQKDGDDIYQVNNTIVDFGAALMGLSLFDGAACVCLEPLQELSSSQKSGGNILQMLYDKPSRWAYTFQVKAPECILSGGDVVILQSLTRLPALFCLSELRVSQQSPFAASGPIRSTQGC